MSLPASTYRHRVRRIAEGLRRRRLAALIVEPGSDFLYLTGLAAGRSERLIAALVTADAEVCVVGPDFERDILARTTIPAELHTWLEHEDPFPLLAKILPRRPRPIAVGPTTRHFVVERLSRAVRGRPIHDGGPILQAARVCKSDEEVAAIREACRRTLALMRSIPRRVDEGMSEVELARKLGAALVQFGENSAVPHGRPGVRILRRGDVILVDTGHRVHGYTSDITRTMVFGRKNARFRKIHRIVERAQQEGIRALRPGATCESVDAAARRVIDRAGFGRFFIHRLGHGLGLDGHEPPYLVRGNRTKLKPGMVVTVEPGIYLPGEFGVRIEDDVLVTESGPKILSRD